MTVIILTLLSLIKYSPVVTGVEWKWLLNISDQGKNMHGDMQIESSVIIKLECSDVVASRERRKNGQRGEMK